MLLVDEELTSKVIGAAIEVHRTLGPGLLENVYEQCLAYELELLGIQYQNQVWVDLHY
jgi:GxxExxY protein